MSYHWATKSTGDPEEWFEGNKVVVVATGSHDCSRLVQALRSGNCEQHRLGEQIASSLNRHPLGRRVTELLKRHGGEDLTSVSDQSELDRLRTAVWSVGDPWYSDGDDSHCFFCRNWDLDGHEDDCVWVAEDKRRMAADSSKTQRQL